MCGPAAPTSATGWSDWVPLLAAGIALAAAVLVALYNSTSQALQHSRQEVRERVAAVRASLGRLSAARNAPHFKGLPGFTPQQVKRLDDMSVEAFWSNYQDATFQARADLAGLGTGDAYVDEIVTREESQISPDEINELHSILSKYQEVELAKLTRWWIPTVG